MQIIVPLMGLAFIGFFVMQILRFVMTSLYSIQAAERAVGALAKSGPHTLTDAELEKVRTLLGQGTEDGLRLASVALESCDATDADRAATFTPAVLKHLAEKSSPQSWPLAMQSIRSVAPCVKLFSRYVAAHLDASRSSLWLDAGFMGHVYPNAAVQEPYKVLLENNFPQQFMDAVSPAVADTIARRSFNSNMWGSYDVYAFPFEVLTSLSAEGARILAGLPVGEGATRIAQPFWEPYGRHLLLARISHLSDEAALALSGAKREILFGNLEAFPDSTGHVKLAKRLSSQKNVVLGAHTRLEPVIADILSAVTVSPPTATYDLLYCDLLTPQDHNRKAFVSVGGGVPNILH
jgi:hypothetical protein